MVLVGIVVAALLAIVLVLLFLWPGWAITTTLDAKSVEKGVADVLARKQIMVQNVRCPDDQEVEDGNRFTCDATVGGQPKKVPITITGADDDPPEYLVGNPQ